MSLFERTLDTRMILGARDVAEDDVRVLALHARWTEEFVEALNLCPFARQARLQGRSPVHVLRGVVPCVPEAVDEAPAIEAAQREQLGTTDAEVVQFVFPGLRVDALAWEKIGKAWAQRLRTHNETGWAVAAFHPDAAYGRRTAASLVPLFRRTPFPTIQWLRLDVLARVREGRNDRERFVAPGSAEFLALLHQPPKPGIAALVADANLVTAERVGIDVLEARLRALALDAVLCYPT